MQITFVGTGSGIMQKNRFHTSLLVTCNSHNLLIDTGDGVAKAILSAGIDYNEIDSVFITHTHADHFSGLASLLTQMKFHKRTKPLFLYIHSAFKNFVSGYLHHSFLFPSAFNFKFEIIGYEFGKEIPLVKNFKLIPLQNTHVKNKHNIHATSDLQFISSSVLLIGAGMKVQYTSDVGGITDLSLFENYHPDYFISEATHIPFAEIVKYISDADFKNSFLVHINDSDKIIEQHRKLSEKNRSKIIVAFDGMKVKLT